MRPLIVEVQTPHSPEQLVERLSGVAGVMLVPGASIDASRARYSIVVAQPFLTFRSAGPRCVLQNFDCGDDRCGPASHIQFGNPWQVLEGLMARYELLDEIDLPFPLGGCFGYWGYDLKNFVEPKLPRRAVNDLELSDCHVGFHDSLVVFDHRLGKTWVVSTGLDADGSRREELAGRQLDFWQAHLNSEVRATEHGTRNTEHATVSSNFSRADFLARVNRAQAYIRAGDIYQVNLSQRLSAPCGFGGWELFQRLAAVSP